MHCIRKTQILFRVRQGKEKTYESQMSQRATASPFQALTGFADAARKNKIPIGSYSAFSDAMNRLEQLVKAARRASIGDPGARQKVDQIDHETTRFLESRIPPATFELWQMMDYIGAPDFYKDAELDAASVAQELGNMVGKVRRLAGGDIRLVDYANKLYNQGMELLVEGESESKSMDND
jgi:hypothetical protein